MELVEYTADDQASLGRAAELITAADAVDAPWQRPTTAYRQEMFVRFGWSGEPPTVFLAVDGEELIGHLTIHASNYDNLEVAWIEPVVRPELRRRGHGSELLALAERQCLVLGRPSVGGGCWDGHGYDAFAEAHGYPQASIEVNRWLYLDEVAGEVIDTAALEAEAASADYDLLRFDGPVPEDMLPSLVEVTDSINDAPLDDLDIEPEVYSPERLRRYEDTQRASQRRLYRLVARHRASGELAGHTVVVVEAERPDHAYQHDTAVARTHRGHRLGLLLKAQMVRWLRETEPPVRTIDTWNAESNAHMIGVNERLGFRAMGRTLDFQKRLD